MAVLCVALVGMALAASASACSCAPQAPAESLRQSDAAIVGRLVAVAPRGPLRADYRYAVGRVYRGAGIEAGEVLTVRSARRGAACALPRRPGRRYGLFLVRGGGRWHGGICGTIAPRRLWQAAQGGAGAAALPGPAFGFCRPRQQRPSTLRPR
jgi:hypothetical protein